MVQNNLTAKEVRERADELSFPSSVIEFMQGQLGQVDSLSFTFYLNANFLNSSHMVDFLNHFVHKC
jgi:pyruvate carboxylase